MTPAPERVGRGEIAAALARLDNVDTDAANALRAWLDLYDVPDEGLLRLRYVPIDQVILWEDNPKRHDIGGLVQAFQRHGMKDPCKFEPELNGGRGGLGHGNGRATALKWMAEQGEPPPRGVAVGPDGSWHVPVIFGVDAGSEAAAESYAVDHNNLTMSGGDFTAWDMARMWGNEYLDVLKDLAMASQLPVTVNGDDVDVLLKSLKKYDPASVEFPEYDESVVEGVEFMECPKCGHRWPR